MPITWDKLPLEMREAIVSETDVRTRLNLSMCSKSDNQLVRSARYGKVEWIKLVRNTFEISFILDCRTNVERRVFVAARDDGGLIRYGNQKDDYKYLTTSDWRHIIWNIMSLMGEKVTVDKLELVPYRGFQQLFNWFRSNFHIKPQLVEINIDINCCYNEAILDWPLNTKIELNVCCIRLPNLERFNTYDKIVTIDFYGSVLKCESMTDEELKKMRNAKIVNLKFSEVTIDGFFWWINKWLTQLDNELYKYSTCFPEGSDTFSLENIANTLSDVIGNTERCFDNDRDKMYWKFDIMKNGIIGGTIKLFDDELIFESERNP